MFWLKFENNTLIFEISALEFVKLQSFVKKQKFLKLKLKMSLLGVLECNFERLLSYLRSAPSNLYYLQSLVQKIDPAV